ncbi:unnamed protein product [Ilex paraguariensis]|uniref:RsdA/BaiN/AoA(So)-like Rossmann fold-like domain-containing protein n=1 Tax=Ilex paraguariensis TaxID=185542 RepID=A0ABC8U4Z4_9AQUA
MSITFQRFILQSGFTFQSSTITRNYGYFHFFPRKRRFCACTLSLSQKKSSEELLVVVGGGAAGIYGAIMAKTTAPNLQVVVIEKGKPLSKVKISGGGRCNVTNGNFADNMTIIQGVTRN